MAQFFKRCSCGTGAEEDISHECFKRNCGSNPTAGLNHLKALSRATSLTPTFFPAPFLAAALTLPRAPTASSTSASHPLPPLSLSLSPLPLPPSFFRLFNLAFVLAPFFSLSGYHIVSLSYPPGAASVLLDLAPSRAICLSLSLFRHTCGLFLTPTGFLQDTSKPRFFLLGEVTTEQRSYELGAAGAPNGYL